jgi:hypothetical protein
MYDSYATVDHRGLISDDEPADQGNSDVDDSTTASGYGE